MNILIVANNLSQGGVQTSLLNLLKEISKDPRYNIDLFLFSDITKKLEEIPKNVNVIKGNYFLKLTGVSFKEVIKTKNIINIVVRIFLMILVRIIKPKRYFKMIFKLNKNSKKYDYAVSFFNDIPNNFFNKGATYYVLDLVNAKKKIGWIHTDIKQANYSANYFKKEYDKFDYIINVSKHCKEIYDELIPEQKNKSYVIYNFFPIEEIRKKALEQQNDIKKNENCKIFVTVARLDNISKRIDRIIETVKILYNKNLKSFTWYIIGDGPDYKEIKEKVKMENLEENIILLGDKLNPYPYIKIADLFVLTSDFEGFPMVVGESLAIGTPVLTTKYDSSAEQIKNKYNGIIVEKNEKSLAQALENIMKDDTIIKKLKDNLQKEKISNDIAKKQFDRIFGEIDGK